MKKEFAEITFWVFVVCVAAFLIWAVISNQKAQEAKAQTRVYELVDKTTEVRTHRYLMVENAIETDHLLVWKSSTGRTFSVEVGRNSYYNYQIGKRYRFTIYPDRSEQFQIQQACR